VATAVLAEDAVGDEQPQTGAVFTLGGEKGCENIGRVASSMPMPLSDTLK
jgi:hypothetical protein